MTTQGPSCHSIEARRFSPHQVATPSPTLLLFHPHSSPSPPATGCQLSHSLEHPMPSSCARTLFCATTLAHLVMSLSCLVVYGRHWYVPVICAVFWLLCSSSHPIGPNPKHSQSGVFGRRRPGVGTAAGSCFLLFCFFSGPLLLSRGEPAATPRPHAGSTGWKRRRHVAGFCSRPRQSFGSRCQEEDHCRSNRTQKEIQKHPHEQHHRRCTDKHHNAKSRS